MAGRGPAPKDPSRRARRNVDPTPKTVLRFERAEQPPLPDDADWHPQTIAWWAMWAESPQAEHFMSTDWDYLLDTALIHNTLWSERQFALAGELRLRIAKFGATPEDRARLRMQFADADDKDAKRPATKPATERYGDLKVFPGGPDAVAGA